ncbi:MAG TPA: hypothetical protein VIE65_11335, partial [Methylobacter sp.]
MNNYDPPQLPEVQPNNVDKVQVQVQDEDSDGRSNRPYTGMRCPTSVLLDSNECNRNVFRSLVRLGFRILS